MPQFLCMDFSIFFRWRSSFSFILQLINLRKSTAKKRPKRFSTAVRKLRTDNELIIFPLPIWSTLFCCPKTSLFIFLWILLDQKMNYKEWLFFKMWGFGWLFICLGLTRCVNFQNFNASSLNNWPCFLHLALGQCMNELAGQDPSPSATSPHLWGYWTFIDEMEKTYFSYQTPGSVQSWGGWWNSL